MKNLPKNIKNLTKNKQEVKNITTYCTNNKNCKYKLIATVALRGIEGKYRKTIKFNGGKP